MKLKHFTIRVSTKTLENATVAASFDDFSNVLRHEVGAQNADLCNSTIVEKSKILVNCPG